MGQIDGNSDDISNYQQQTQFVEGWYMIYVRDTSAIGDLNANVSLTNPPGVRFGLWVTCFSCSTQGLWKQVEPAQNSEGHVFFGSADHVECVWPFDGDCNDDFHLLIHVYYLSSDNTSCGNYTLKVSGTEVVSDRTCDHGDPGNG
jgi:hypothetical protein